MSGEASGDIELLMGKFVDAFNRHDVDGIMSLMSEDCVYESAGPAPDGMVYTGAAEVRGAWEALFRDRPSGHFDEEETVVLGDRALTRWKFKWDTDSGQSYVRGTDIMRVQNGKIVEKLTYVKR